MKQSFLNRADLLRSMLSVNSPDSIRDLFNARLCGYSPLLPTVDDMPFDIPTEKPEKKSPGNVQSSEKPTLGGNPLSELTTFWIAAGCEILTIETANRLHDVPQEFRIIKERFTDRNLSWAETPILGAPLLQWSKLWSFLRRALGRKRASRQVDVGRLVSLLVSGKPVRRIPRKKRLGWNRNAHLLLDRRISMQPYWDDYDDLIKRLKRLRGAGGLKILTIEANIASADPSPSGFRTQSYTSAKRSRPPYRLPELGTSVLVLGDLHLLTPDPEYVNAWRSLGIAFGKKGITPWILSPCPRSRWTTELAGIWRMAYWDRGQRLPKAALGQSALPIPLDELQEQKQAQVKKLRNLVSPAVRVERGLLRDIRLLCSNAELDAASEYDLWESDWSYGKILGLSLHPEPLKKGREQLKNLPREQLYDVVRLIRKYHGPCDQVIGPAETLGLQGFLKKEQWDCLLKDKIIPPDAVTWAEKFFKILVMTLADERHTQNENWLKGLASWGDRDLHRLDDKSLTNLAFQSMWALARSIFKDGDCREAVPNFVNKDTIDWVSSLSSQDRLFIAGIITNGGMRIARRHVEKKIRFPLYNFATRTDSLWACFSNGQGQFMEARQLDLASGESLYWDDETLPNQISLNSDRECFHLKSIHRPDWARRMGYDRYGVYADLEVKRVRFRLRWISPGRFWMGEEGERHEVTLTMGFWLGETQTTQALWKAVMDQNPSYFQSDDQRPVENVSWVDCNNFLGRLGELIPGLYFALPTEAQWEYACRAGTETRFNNGSDEDASLNTLGWYYDNSEIKDKRQTHPVGKKQANNWGLYDMHGNVDEWGLDGKRTYDREAVSDPVGPTDKKSGRVVRGGSWGNSARYCRSAYRFAFVPDFRHEDLGFRLAAGQKQEQLSGAVGLWAEGADAPRPWDKVSDSRPTSAAIRPIWAKEVDDDEFGILAVFTISGVRFAFRKIEPGTFEMGSPDDEKGRWDDEGPRHKVTVSKAFWMALTPTTQAQWQAVMNKNPCRFKGKDRPVEEVSWHDCVSYCDKLNKLIPKLKATLPTEAQWEYACRAGTNTAFNDGSDCTELTGKDLALDPLGWYGGNSGSQSHPVGEKKANSWGVYDMHGNVKEWCLDGMRNYDRKAVSDPVGPTRKNARRVVRGGSWHDFAGHCRSAIRDAFEPGIRNVDLGFRLAAGQELL